MIYNEELTDKLIILYGEDVIDLPKSIIRNKLEDTIAYHKDKIFNEAKLGKKIREENSVLYTTTIDIESMFMENYTKELDLNL